MIILDHNITEDQADLLRKWKIRFRKIGIEVGRPEWEDRQVISRYMRRIKQAPLFSRDSNFFNENQGDALRQSHQIVASRNFLVAIGAEQQQDTIW